MDMADLAAIQAIEIKPKPLHTTGPSMSECIYCGEDIPAERQAYGAVIYCIVCKDLIERGRITP
jgi:RNA polymerase-binding transcription factor DksA